ncbi:uncharacterized protein L969DRAFT_96910 [Mixia osmundae IAM 14324]|uniref:S-adenosylmethionine transporter n=1 Tax=Mixia osmundae (strain CBS 9802 / IAM 14324 / JCM 22182 / KY 12970) TaxID=764103 RepID=G7E2G3_MIXOS|nr:uncharacterized protein L969DRAFT_96910 [Mixia osmundae IAM 14324]KEI36893.1 hypothetical protein L969DRAFT_96910 [Mixia osmundae IAM 14324]GAA97023.1 hypothetical protein E5Q_03698 [Mixia osmundae IAM 14324]
MNNDDRAKPVTTALLSGAAAGLSVDILFFPIDTVKTRLQSSQGFWSSGGFSGVYRGLGSVVVGSAPGAAFFFTSYETLKTRLPHLPGCDGLRHERGQPLLHMLAASGGEIAACLIRVPTEVVKSRSQVSLYADGQKQHQGSLYALRQVIAHEGVRGLYRGFGSTVAREIPFTCIQFPMYERLKLALAKRKTTSGSVQDLSLQATALCGSLAGSVSAALTTPLDVAKTRIMLSRRSGSAVPSEQVYSSQILPTIRRVYTDEGLAALFSGVVPRTLWIGLGGAVFLGVYEASCRTLA